MRKFAIIACTAVAVALVGASLASAGNPTSAEHAKNLAAKQCHAEKKADKGAFHATYGKHAMRNCKKGTTDEKQTELKNAAQECKGERSGDPDTFAATYGDGRNAFGKCVSTKAREDKQEDVADFKNAAKECKAEREADSDAFKETYGTEHSKGRNALGKCVSSKVKKAEDDTSS